MGSEVLLCEDVTRDGFACASNVVNVEDKLKIIEWLVDAGVKSIEVGALSKYESMKKMRNTNEVFKHLQQQPNVLYKALIYDPEGVKEAAECGCKTVKINISASNKHHLKGTGMTIDQALVGFKEIASIAHESHISMQGSISLPFRSPFPGEGVTPMETLLKIIDGFYNIGVRTISLSDSAGLGDPRMIYERFKYVSQQYPDVTWMLHMHNTYGMGLAGVEAAYRAGVRKFDSSVSGLGGCPYIKGATGNVATEDVVFMFEKMGVKTGIDLKKLIAIGKYASECVPGEVTDSYIQKIHSLGKKEELL